MTQKINFQDLNGREANTSRAGRYTWNILSYAMPLNVELSCFIHEPIREVKPTGSLCLWTHKSLLFHFLFEAMPLKENDTSDKNVHDLAQQQHYNSSDALLLFIAALTAKIIEPKIATLIFCNGNSARHELRSFFIVFLPNVLVMMTTANSAP